MPTTSEQIDAMLEEQELKVFKSSDEDDNWMIPFEAFHVQVSLREEGEFVWFRGSLLADLEELSDKERLRALKHFMELNDQIKVGRFCGYPQIAFEVGFPVEDGELTFAQFRRCLGTAIQTTAENRYVPQAMDSLDSLLLTGSSRFPSPGSSTNCN